MSSMRSASSSTRYSSPLRLRNYGARKFDRGTAGRGDEHVPYRCGRRALAAPIATPEDRRRDGEAMCLHRELLQMSRICPPAPASA